MSNPVVLSSRVIEGAASGPHLLITAGIHGDEFEGMAAIRRLIATITPQELRGRLTLIPVVNEPAFLRGQRTAEDGLDLARRCPGDVAGTVTDAIAAALSDVIRTANYYIDLHSGGVAMSVAPLAGYMLHANPQVLDEQRRMAKAFNLPLVWGTSPMLEGRSLSVARDANVPAIYVEYLGSGLCSDEGADDYFLGCLNVMGELGMIARLPVPSRVERIVEDARPNSGHLQISHPAPITGFFEPAVKLRQEVSVADLIGRVVNLLGDDAHEVHAETRGMVICLATYSRVLAGSGLAVILDVDALSAMATNS